MAPLDGGVVALRVVGPDALVGAQLVVLLGDGLIGRVVLAALECRVAGPGSDHIAHEATVGAFGSQREIPKTKIQDDGVATTEIVGVGAGRLSVAPEKCR